MSAVHAGGLPSHPGPIDADRDAGLVVAPRILGKEHPMLDLILLAAGLGFFALSIAYAFGCERL